MKRIKIKQIIVLLLGTLLISYPVFADDDITALKTQVKELQKRIEQLESSRASKQNQSLSNNVFPQNNFTADPFLQLNRMQEEMNRMFQNAFSNQKWQSSGMFNSNMSYNPNVGIKDTGKNYELRFDTKGLDKDKINVEINNHSVTLSGEYSSSSKGNNKNAYYSSSNYSSFLKTIPLPYDADTKKVQTKKEGDAIIITMPKTGK